MKCHCGSGKEYADCCAALIEGATHAVSPEALMRSRYSAYVEGSGAYLVATTLPIKQIPEDAELIRAHAEQSTWLGLKVLDTHECDGRATVVFKAFYKEGGAIKVHHEKSRFVKENGRWYYDSGELYATSIGRNDPCPCGSGKKYKKCCMV